MELPLTESFKLRCKLMGFFTLNDIIIADQNVLHLNNDYSERWYFEFIDFLQRKDLIYLLG